jgi:hypothetical protein
MVLYEDGNVVKIVCRELTMAIDANKVKLSWPIIPSYYSQTPLRFHFFTAFPSALKKLFFFGAAGGVSTTGAGISRAFRFAKIASARFKSSSKSTKTTPHFGQVSSLIPISCSQPSQIFVFGASAIVFPLPLALCRKPASSVFA